MARDDRHDLRTQRRALLKTMGIAAASVVIARHTPARGADTAAAPPQPGTPDEAIAALEAGNQRYIDHKPQVRTTEEIERIWTKKVAGQAPFATVLGCADSRLAPELIFDQFIGDIFVVREAGNIADSPTNLGSLEFGQAVLGSKLILVLGHSSCGAVRAAFENATPPGNIGSIVKAIKPGIGGAKTLDEAITENVRAVQQRIREKSTILRDAEKSGKIKIVGGVYSLADGKVTFLD